MCGTCPDFQGMLRDSSFKSWKSTAGWQKVSLSWTAVKILIHVPKGEPSEENF